MSRSAFLKADANGEPSILGVGGYKWVESGQAAFRRPWAIVAVPGKHRINPLGVEFREPLTACFRPERPPIDAAVETGLIVM